jgi:hypothetical protein
VLLHGGADDTGFVQVMKIRWVKRAQIERLTVGVEAT